MTVHRKLLKVKTKGSRSTGDLSPDFIDRLPRGINYVVHEYNEEEGWCIVELDCCDHECMCVEERKNMADLEAFANDPAVLDKTLKSHPKSPKTLVQHVAHRPVDPKHRQRYGFESVDETAKTIKVRGKVLKFKRKRKEKYRDTGGVEIEDYVLDEG